MFEFQLKYPQRQTATRQQPISRPRIPRPGDSAALRHLTGFEEGNRDLDGIPGPAHKKTEKGPEVGQILSQVIPVTAQDDGSCVSGHYHANGSNCPIKDKCARLHRFQGIKEVRAKFARCIDHYNHECPPHSRSISECPIRRSSTPTPLLE
jgi:hypothetical protein